MLGSLLLKPHRARRRVSTESAAELFEDIFEGEGYINEHVAIGIDVAVLSYVLIALVVTAVWADRKKLPASAVAIVVGVVIGTVLRLSGAELSPHHNESFSSFDEELFLYVLLPPIIFEAGFSLSKRLFFGNLGTIILFAIVGTLGTTFDVGQTVYAVGSTGVFRSADGVSDVLNFSGPLDSYLFGALISATDPVATLSIMSRVNADPVVYTLIFGESVLNDAVAIVLVRIIESMGPEGFSRPSSYLFGMLQFFVVALGSIAIGAAVSFASAYLLKKCEMRHHASFELAFVLLIGYCSYSTAEATGCSGILALFFTGVLIGAPREAQPSPRPPPPCPRPRPEAPALSSSANVSSLSPPLAPPRPLRQATTTCIPSPPPRATRRPSRRGEPTP